MPYDLLLIPVVDIVSGALGGDCQKFAFYDISGQMLAVHVQPTGPDAGDPLSILSADVLDSDGGMLYDHGVPPIELYDGQPVFFDMIMPESGDFIVRVCGVLNPFSEFELIITAFDD